MDAEDGGTAEDRGESVERRPPEWMRGDVVRCRGYRSAGVRNPRVTLPSAAVTLLVGWGEPLHIRQGLGGVARERTRHAMIAGLQTAPVLAGYRGSGHALEIEFTAVGASRVFGLPLHLLANAAAHPDEAMGQGWTARLTERLAQAPDWAARWEVVDAVLGPRLAAAPAAPGLAVEAWQRLSDAHGGLTARELAAATGRGERRLQHVFRDHVGVPPQTVSRILRFRRALALSGRARLSLTEVAAMSGYHDQAHMNRDFRALSGRTPGQLRLVADRLAADGGVACVSEPGCLSDFFEVGAADWWP
ncbi:helix-turn-helix domain-containing protein [Kitasatospora sp. NPDC057500]|uniref:helix-turn-helix domain-containing protein n=1 Tax=Kitasatospora sp. NPDC057500 TaxID=3346151 RepID=UPI0036BCD402